MQQTELNRAVARATGETISTVKKLGFLLDDPDHCRDSEVETIDWDELESRRFAGMSRTSRHEPAVV